ncbi:MAG: glycosyltransferase family protein, partial [bacterium]
MPNILYYISGHGYGHATRSIELIKALMLKSPNLYFHIKTDAPEWIFNLNLKENYSLDRIKIDVGTVQNTSFYIDKKETLNEWDDLLNKKDAIVEEEVAYAEKLKAKIIIADIPPLAFDMARKAGIPSVALANFTWDWIYSHYTEDYPDFSCLVQQIKSSYRKADLLLRLPFYGDLSVFPKIKDIPLIARQAIKSKAEILELLN